MGCVKGNNEAEELMVQSNAFLEPDDLVEEEAARVIVGKKGIFISMDPFGKQLKFNG